VVQLESLLIKEFIEKTRNCHKLVLTALFLSVHGITELENLTLVVHLNTSFYDSAFKYQFSIWIRADDAYFVGEIYTL